MGRITFVEILVAHEEDEPNNYEHRKQDRDRIFYNIRKERGHFDTYLLGNGFHHEIWPVSNVSESTKEYGS